MQLWDKLLPSNEYWNNPSKYLPTFCSKESEDEFLLSISGSNDGFLNCDDYYNLLNNLNNEGYITFANNESTEVKRFYQD